MIVLGIETSCDETAASVVSSDGRILSNQVLSQIEAHELYGGVVPEIAAREHIKHLPPLIKAAMSEAGAQSGKKTGLDYTDLDGVAATSGPGLIGGVMVGMMMGKSIAAAHNLPFAAINHLEGHALSPRLKNSLDRPLEFPFLLLLVSGGHTALIHALGVGRYQLVGTTLDDALGELFDKSGKMMGLAYPAGPEIEAMALRCPDIPMACEKFPLPRPMIGRKNADFSFSGLKTAMRHHIDALPAGPLEEKDVSDLSAAMQESVADVLEDRCARAIEIIEAETGEKKRDGERGVNGIVIAGGVAANQRLQKGLKDFASSRSLEIFAPPGYLCSDNAAMIAWAGIENFKTFGPRYDMDAAPRPRWPLDELRDELKNARQQKRKEA